MDSSSPINSGYTPTSQEYYNLSSKHPFSCGYPSGHNDPSSYSTRLPECRYVLVDSILVLVDSSLPPVHTNSPSLHSAGPISFSLPSVSYKLQVSNLVSDLSYVRHCSSMNVHPIQTIKNVFTSSSSYFH